jgi:serine protease
MARLGLGSLILALGAISLAPLPAHAERVATPSVQGQLIVRWRADAPTTTRDLRRCAPGASRLRELGGEAELWQLQAKDATATRRALELLRADPRVAAAQPNYRRRLLLRPNDPHYPVQWHLPRIRAEQAWELAGSVRVIVAVIDTGIRGSHPEFEGQLLPGYDFISSLADAGDEDGRDGLPLDEGGSSGFHGTNVAGLIAARGNNGQGIAGVCWQCRVLPVRALGVRRTGTDADIADAIRWAAGLPVPGVPNNVYPAQIINLSLGGENPSDHLTRAVRAAQATGALVVAAAGNHAVDARNTYPAAIPGVLAVGASGYSTQRAPYSNFGAVINLLAPGGVVTETLPGLHLGRSYNAGLLSTMYIANGNSFGYASDEGTSNAAPVVSGVLGLMLSVRPDLGADAAFEILRRTADPAYRCAEGCGAGQVNAEAALLEVRACSADSCYRPKSNHGPNLLVGGCRLARAADLRSDLTLLALLLLALIRRRARR